MVDHVIKELFPSIEPGLTVEAWLCIAPCCGGKKLHRLDGPALICPHGIKLWYLHGKQVSRETVLAYANEREMEERRAFEDKVDREFTQDGVCVAPMKAIKLTTGK